MPDDRTRDRDTRDAPRTDPASAQAARTAPSPPGVRADVPTGQQPGSQAQRDINLGGQDQPEVSNITIPGGRYRMPDGGFVNANGEPIDESGNRLDQNQGQQR